MPTVASLRPSTVSVADLGRRAAVTIGDRVGEGHRGQCSASPESVGERCPGRRRGDHRHRRIRGLPPTARVSQWSTASPSTSLSLAVTSRTAVPSSAMPAMRSAAATGAVVADALDDPGHGRGKSRNAIEGHVVHSDRRRAARPRGLKAMWDGLSAKRPSWRRMRTRQSGGQQRDRSGSVITSPRSICGPSSRAVAPGRSSAARRTRSKPRFRPASAPRRKRSARTPRCGANPAQRPGIEARRHDWAESGSALPRRGKRWRRDWKRSRTRAPSLRRSSFVLVVRIGLGSAAPRPGKSTAVRTS